MRGLKNKIDGLLEATISALMALLVGDVLWQVFSRFVLRDASSFTEELARYILVWVSLLGASYGVSGKLHLGVDLLPGSLREKGKWKLEVVIDGFIFLFALFALVIGGGRLVFISFYLHQVSAALRLPLGYVYVSVPLAGVLILFYSGLSILEGMRKISLEEGEAMQEATPTPPPERLGID